MSGATTLAAGFAYATPDEAVEAMIARLSAVDEKTVALNDAAGRILAEPIKSDRPSPPCDVSAMDGYAVRLSDLDRPSIPVVGEAVTGGAIVDLPSGGGGGAMRIFTGGPVPRGAEAVIRREDVDEQPDRIVLSVARDRIKPGQNIRREGENIGAGQVVVETGCMVTAATISAAANFGAMSVRVRRKLRVAVIVTGDELREMGSDPISTSQLRDSNGPGLRSMLSRLGWVEMLESQRVGDDPRAIEDAVGRAMPRCDALLMSGGVSAGDHDYVPDALRQCGAEVVFHKLPIRPGKPMLGAVGPGGQAIFGLPGNPVSVLVTARRIAMPALLHRAGGKMRPAAQVKLANSDGATLKLHWFRLVRCVDTGVVELVDTRGSGDLVSAARSDGFVEQPMGEDGRGLLAFYPWEVA